MISIINRIKKPVKGNGILPSAEYLTYEVLVPKLIAQLKKVSAPGRSVKVTLSGTVKNIQLSTDSDDEELIKKLKSVIK